MTAVPQVQWIEPDTSTALPALPPQGVAFDGLTDIQIDAVLDAAEALEMDPQVLAVDLFPLIYIKPDYSKGGSS